MIRWGKKQMWKEQNHDGKSKRKKQLPPAMPGARPEKKQVGGLLENHD